MVLVLTIGDLHIPHLVPELPPKFLELLVPGKIEVTICTGNLCTVETEEFLKKISPQVYITAGDMDDEDYEERLIVNVDGLLFGIVHGHQILPWGNKIGLSAMKRDMGVDVLVSGHTHEMKIEKGDDGGLLVNPGTGTGAPNVLEVEAPPPSFVLMDVQGPRIVTYSYTLVDEVRIARAGMCEKEMEVKVDRAVYDRVK